MSALSIQVPFPVFQGRDGQPLENGYVWIGEPNLNPQTNPVVAYYDEALTIVAPQPLRTLNGYISHAGTPAQVYVNAANFSILVQDSKGSMVYNFPEGSGVKSDASGVTYNPPFTGGVETTVELKLSQTVSVKDFGAVGDNVADDTAAIQLAYNYIATQGGGTVTWPSATYKVNGTICFSTNTSTDLCKSRIYANNQILFDCGYLSAGVVISNNATSNVDYSTALQNAVIGNGTIYGASLAFRLFKFLSGCRIHDIMCWDVGQIISARTCFYSDYSNIIRYETVDGSPKVGTATTRLGDSAIDVPNAMAANLALGMTIGAGFVPYGTTITLVGAANSAGAGFAFVFLSAAATYAVASGAANSGFAASANLTPLYKFVGECSNLTFTKCSSASRFIGWELSDVNSSTFVAWDVTACAYGFQFKQSCGGNDFTSGYTEGVYQWIFDFTQNIGAGGTVISVANYFQTAGAITAGPTGYVSGSITIPADIVGFTPYGYGPGGGPLVNLQSPNAKITVIGGNADSKVQNPTSKSVFLTQGGLSLPNVVSSDPNTLDWYEENTFTPVLEGTTSAGVGTYTAQLGKFTRIGNRVFFTINLAWTAHTGTGNMLVSGLPYPPALVYRIFSLTGVDLSYTNGNQLVGQMGALSFTKIEVVQIAAAGSPAAIAMDTAAQILIFGNYEL
jgi:hypothetical protein